MSPRLKEQYKDLCEYLTNIENRQDRRQVINELHGTLAIKQISFLGSWTEYKDKHCRAFDRYSFNYYTEQRGLPIKYIGQGLFRITKEIG